MFSHVTLGSNNLEKASLFYDATLAPLAWTIHETSDYRAGPCVCREFRRAAQTPSNGLDAIATFVNHSMMPRYTSSPISAMVFVDQHGSNTFYQIRVKSCLHRKLQFYRQANF